MNTSQTTIPEPDAKAALASINSIKQQTLTKMRTPWWYCFISSTLVATQWYCIINYKSVVESPSWLSMLGICASLLLILGIGFWIAVLRKHGIKSNLSELSIFEKFTSVGAALVIVALIPGGIVFVNEVNAHWPLWLIVVVVFGLWTFLMRRFPLV